MKKENLDKFDRVLIRSVRVMAGILVGASLLTLSGDKISANLSDQEYLVAQDCYNYYNEEGFLSTQKVLEILGADDSYLSQVDNGISRSLITKDRPLYIYADDTVSEDIKAYISKYINHMNSMFELINPDIKFEYISEYKNGVENVVKVTMVDGSFLQNSAGRTFVDYKQVKDNFYSYDCSIMLNKDYNPFPYFEASIYQVFDHEMGHVLGFKDLYHIEDYKVPTAMKVSSTSFKNKYSANDFYCLGALYGNFKSEDDVIAYKLLVDTVMAGEENSNKYISFGYPLFSASKFKNAFKKDKDNNLNGYRWRYIESQDNDENNP